MEVGAVVDGPHLAHVQSADVADPLCRDLVPHVVVGLEVVGRLDGDVIDNGPEGRFNRQILV